MTTNINITQTWWRLLSAVGSTLITLVAWLGYMALCMVGEVILGIVYNPQNEMFSHFGTKR